MLAENCLRMGAAQGGSYQPAAMAGCGRPGTMVLAVKAGEASSELSRGTGA